jgi:hypothetical protein
MNQAKAKEIKKKVFQAMYGSGYSKADRKILMATDSFIMAYELAKRKYKSK